MYDALSHPVDIDQGHEPDLSIYRDGGKPVHGKFPITTPFHGRISVGNGRYTQPTNKMEIAYTQRGDKGPLVLLLHGVPTNRYQYFPIQKRLAPFCRTIAIDMLGMGQSTMPRMYGKESIDAGKAGINEPWDWVFDVDYVEQIMQGLYPGEKFYFVADDWGSGINSHYTAKYPGKLLGYVQIDPIAFDGYPVAEIQAIGRASQIPIVDEQDSKFKELMGAIDQTMVQIFKTMVYDPNVFNQYSLRALKHPYVDVDYDRSKFRDGEDATTLTLRLKWEAIRVLADRAAILSPALLLPYDEIKNPKGVQFRKITSPTLILWGSKDNMMNEMQRHRFKYAMPNAPVQIQRIPQAGHFSAIDQPDCVAEEILNFITLHSGKRVLADVFLGFDGIWKGDERVMIKDLRNIYNIQVYMINKFLTY